MRPAAPLLPATTAAEYYCLLLAADFDWPPVLHCSEHGACATLRLISAHLLSLQIQQSAQGQQPPCNHHTQQSHPQPPPAAPVTSHMANLGEIDHNRYTLYPEEDRRGAVRERELPVWLAPPVEEGGHGVQNKFQYGDEGTFSGTGPSTMEDSAVSSGGSGGGGSRGSVGSIGSGGSAGSRCSGCSGRSGGGSRRSLNV